ncbi:hypothetical protein EYF80_023319 [Liparis tanakae]|uniref:Uncharacterized protein n=1 Tax=Liparis tanakae TaxID=230148 RepID=A0A4Z2HNR7_9TELE|nr:hypothetical protein EYF80_023319 [Liparis tanakae]
MWMTSPLCVVDGVSEPRRVDDGRHGAGRGYRGSRGSRGGRWLLSQFPLPPGGLVPDGLVSDAGHQAERRNELRSQRNELSSVDRSHSTLHVLRCRLERPSSEWLTCSGGVTAYGGLRPILTAVSTRLSMCVSLPVRMAFRCGVLALALSEVIRLYLGYRIVRMSHEV